MFEAGVDEETFSNIFEDREQVVFNSIEGGKNVEESVNLCEEISIDSGYETRLVHERRLAKWEGEKKLRRIKKVENRLDPKKNKESLLSGKDFFEESWTTFGLRSQLFSK